MGNDDPTRQAALSQGVNLRYDSIIHLNALEDGKISNLPINQNTQTRGFTLTLYSDPHFYYNQSEEWRQSIDYCLKERDSICWVATKSPRCWAHSASDSAPVLCSLGARVRLVSKGGERVIPVHELFVDDGIDYLAKQADEILTGVLIPTTSDQDHCRSAFWKLRRRGSIDFAVLSAAAAVWTDAREIVTRAAVYLGAVGSSPTPVDVEPLLVGKVRSEDLIIQAAQLAQKVATPMDNTDFAAAWRGKMAHSYTHAALNEIAGLPVRCAPPRHGLTVV